MHLPSQTRRLEELVGSRERESRVSGQEKAQVEVLGPCERQGLRSLDGAIIVASLMERDTQP